MLSSCDSLLTMLLLSSVLLFSLSESCSYDVHQTFAGAEYAIVNTTQGAVRGLAVNSLAPSGGKYFAFKGIPYAKPPVGNLRFKAPEPHDRWTGVRDAFQFGSKCLQSRTKQNGSDDCLFLNVLTPQMPGKGVALKPVIVYIHGGGFTGGSGNTGADLMLAEGVVFVSLNYRLSVLGFLNVNSPEVSSNNGLKDQALALRWVHTNIAEFGGDPSQVTIFGQSAGAASIEFQILTPLSKGLFHRAISDSGSALDPWAFYNTTVDTAFALAKKLNHTTSDVTSLVKFFMSVPAKLLEDNVDPYNSFVPTLEFAHQQGTEVFLPEEPIELLRKGSYEQVPYITGINNKEQKEDPYVIAFINNPALWKTIDMQRFIPEDLHLTKGSKQSTEVAAKMKQFYLGASPSAAQISSLVDADSDFKFVIGVHRSIKQRLAHGNSNLYLYEFSYDGKLNPSNIKGYHYPVAGAAHADDIGYLFYQRVSGVTANSTEAKVSQRMVKMWCNFVKYGDPTRGMQPTWLPSTKASPAHLEIGAESQLVREDLAANRMALWDQIYASLGKA